MGKLDGRVFLVTGAARGQGEQEARLFVEEGAEVVIADVLDDQGEALAKELGARYVHLDVSRECAWRSAVAVTRDAYGRIVREGAPRHVVRRRTPAPRTPWPPAREPDL